MVPGNSVFLSSETDMLGNILSCIKGVKYSFKFQEGTWDFTRDATVVKGLVMTGEPSGFSRVVAGFLSYDGEFRKPFVLAQGSPIFHSSCERELGIALE